MINPKRRLVVKSVIAAGALGAAATAGILVPRSASAARSEAAFRANTYEVALNEATGGVLPEPSDRVMLEIAGGQTTAADGNQVPVEVTTDLGDVERISILVEENPLPLSCSYIPGPGCEPYLSARLKMAKTSGVVALVYAGGKIYSARKEIRLAVGGC